MLMGHLEDQDEVLHCQFSDNSDDEDSEGQEKPRVRYVVGLSVSMVLVIGGFFLVLFAHLILSGDFLLNLLSSLFI